MQGDTADFDLEALTQLLDEDDDLIVSSPKMCQDTNISNGDKFKTDSHLLPPPPSPAVQSPIQYSNASNLKNGSEISENIKAELAEIQKRMVELQERLAKCDTPSTQITSLSNVKSEPVTHNAHLVEKTNVKNPINSGMKKNSQLMDVGIDTLMNSHTGQEVNTADCLKNTLKGEQSLLHLADVDSSDDESLSATGRAIKKRLAHTPKYKVDEMKKPLSSWNTAKRPSLPQVSSLGTKFEKKELDKDKDVKTDFFSGIRIINPLVSSETMKMRMNGRKMVRMSVIRCHMKGGDIEGDWVTMGVVLEKTSPKSSKTGKTFSIWKMSDLRDTTKSVNLFLFGEVHAQHWKTSIGTVVGILNPSFMSGRENYKSEEISLSVDHPGKLMMMGKAKDFGYCKGRRKNGQACTMVVNLANCEYCQYHVKAEYKKLSSKRVELQSSYSGVEPNRLRNKLLNSAPVIYGGHMYSVPPPKPRSAQNKKSKDQLTLDNLVLKRKAETLEREERETSFKKVAHLSENENQVVHTVSSQSEFLSEMLITPGAGSKNLLKHLIKEEKQELVKKKQIQSITPKELLKMHEQQLNSRKLHEAAKLKSHQLSLSTYLSPDSSTDSVAPQLGKGCKPGDFVSLDMNGNIPKTGLSAAEIAKLKAIERIHKKGPLRQVNPNAVRKDTKSPEFQERVRKRVQSETSEKNNPQETEAKSSKLGVIDINSEKFKKILERKSSHAYEVDEEEYEKREKYFSILEKKEQMEIKMQSLTEIICDVVSCLKCKYTTHQPSDLCKNENHPLKRHKAIKRFFKCKGCAFRTVAFSRLPQKACSHCGAFNFEKTSMKASSGPNLTNEQLLIRGEERKFINS